MPGEELETWNDYEDDRLEHLSLAKARGKGAPKKKRSRDGESTCFCRMSWTTSGSVVTEC